MRLQGIIAHVSDVLGTPLGKSFFSVSVLIGFVDMLTLPFILVGLAVLADLVLGIWASVILGQFVLSRVIKDTFKKVTIYGAFLLVVAGIEQVVKGIGIGVAVACGLAAACELWSMAGSGLIIKPDMPFLRLFRMQLKGEIANKIGKNVDHILKTEEHETN